MGERGHWALPCPALALWSRAGKLQQSVGGTGRGKDKQGKRLFRKTWFRTQPPSHLHPAAGLWRESWEASCHVWHCMLSAPFLTLHQSQGQSQGSARAGLKIRALGMTSSSPPAPAPPLAHSLLLPWNLPKAYSSVHCPGDPAHPLFYLLVFVPVGGGPRVKTPFLSCSK